MKVLMRVSVEVDADDVRDAARHRETFEEAASSVLVQFPQAAVRVRPLRRATTHRPAATRRRVHRASGAVLGYRD